jgi:hypothetical protein
MNKLLCNLLLAGAVNLATSNAFAFTVVGGFLFGDNEVKAHTTASSSAGEVHGLYVVANLHGHDTSDNYCDAPANTALFCSTVAEVPSPNPGSSYCAGGFGTDTTAQGVPDLEAVLIWGPSSCAIYRPPSQASINGLSFLGCQQACARWSLQYSASYTSTYRIQWKSPVGSWSTYTVTSNPSKILHLAQNPKQWRVRGENSHGVGPWSSSGFTSGECGGGGGGNLD